jgi:hypothetical protein
MSRGSTAIFNSTVADAGGTGDGAFTCRITWGDGTADTVMTASSMACNTNHVYMGPATKITLVVTDKDGGSVTVTRTINVL